MLFRSRSGKVVGESSNKEAIKPKEQDTVEIQVERQDEEKASTSNKSKEVVKPQGNLTSQGGNRDGKEGMNSQKENKNEGVKAYVPKLPYPTRIHKGAKDQQFPRFLEIFKKLEINIPLAEALEQMPLYAKFLKELITKKRSWQEKETVILNQECSAIIQQGLPPKLKDPGSFLIPCTIGSMAVDKSLCDLGASINLMPLTMMKKMMIEELKPTRMSLQLADRSIKVPNGVVENLLVKVGNFIFPADFVVLDMDEEGNNSVILGRPFLATARTIIDVEKGEMIFRVHDEQMTINVFKAMQYPAEKESYMRIDVVDSLVEEVFETNHQLKQEEVQDIQKQEENKLEEPEEPSEAKKEEVPQQELKPLPPHLKYAFLGEKDSFPVIINSTLNAEEEEKLLVVLKAHKEALGWTIDDLKGISPAVCMHKILLEENSKPVVQPQRRLNPTMKEVVQKEVLKLCKAGIIYPISDSPWVSPVQVVPKKGGMTVIVNEKNELIPTRTVTGWRMCIDYRRLNDATRKDHFPLPFIDQMLERLAGHAYYCFLDGYSGYNQIVVDPMDQEKTSFTCPFGVFAYRRMPFGLCNAPATFQRCMLSIFSDMVEKFIEVFMDDFSVFGDSFNTCLHHLTLVLKRCQETNLVLN